MKLGLMLFLSVMLFLSAMSFSGCAVAETEQGRAVTMMRQDPPAECELIKTVGAKTTSHEAASNKLRNECGEAGGNYLRLDSIWEDGYGIRVRYSGTCFKCPE